MTDTTTTELPAIERTLELAASPERVWRAISDADELARWFPQRAELELVPGSDGRFYWDGHGWFPVRVEAVDPPRYLAWRWGLETDADPTSDATSTLVEWWLEPSGKGTILRMRESGFHQAKQRDGNETGWTEELAELVDLLEAGGAAG